MRSQSRPRGPRRESLSINLGDLLSRYGAVLVRFGGLGFFVCVGYFIYAIYGGVLQGADPQRAHFLISSFGKGLVVSSIVLALGMVIVTLDEVAYAVLVGLGGLALMLGVPYLVASNLSSQLTAEYQTVTRTLSSSGTNAGLGVLAVVALRILYELYIQILEAPERRRVKLEKETTEGILKKGSKSFVGGNITTRCWQMPFCHERIKEICPAFKARKTCWRYGIGCNCDPKLIETLIRMGAPGSGKQTNEMRQRQGDYMRSDLQADIKLGDKQDRTIACTKCPIYNEHQRLKFKFVNPVMILGTVVALGALYQPITGAWAAVAAGIVRVAHNITLRSEFDAGEWFSYLQDDVIRVFFFLIVSLIVLAYVLKFTEWIILQKKW
jgi:hypothetical protein